MANGQITEVVSKEAYSQIEKLLNGLDDITNRVNKINANSRSATLPSQFAGNNKNIAQEFANIDRARQKSIAVIERQRLAEIKLQKQREQAFDRYEKQLAREQGKLEASQSVYNRIQQKLNGLNKEYRDLAIRKEIGVKLTSDEAERYNFLQKRINKYDAALKSVDASMGKYQRNVGNYAGAFNPLSNSINQLTREMPAFANSVQTGFMAISNNLPIFFDSIQQIIVQNKELQAQGKPTQSVLRQIAGSIFSLGTALSVGVTLLTFFGDEIVDFIFNNKEAAKAQEASKKATEEKIEAEKRANNEIATTISREQNRARILFENAKNEELSSSKRIEAIKEIRQLYGKYLGDLTNQQLLAGKTAEAEERLNQALLRRGYAMAAQSLLEKNLTAQLELQIEYNKVSERGLNSLQKTRDEQGRLNTTSEKYFETIRKINKEESAARGVLEQKLKPLKEEEKQLLNLYNSNAKYLDAVNEVTKGTKKQTEQFVQAETNSRVSFERTIQSLQERLGLISKENVLYKILSTQLSIVKDAYEAMYGVQEKVNEETEKTIKYGTVDYYNDLIGRLQAEQSAVATSTREYQLYGVAIQEAQDKLDALTGKQSDFLVKLKEQSKAMSDYLQTFVNDFAQQTGFNTLFKVLQNDIEGFGRSFKAEFEQLEKLKRDGNISDEEYAEATKELNKMRLQSFATTFSAIAEITQEVFNFISQNQRAQTEAALSELDMQQRVVERYAQTEEAKQQIQDQYDEKRREIRRREAQQEKQNAIFNAIINTAQGVTAAYAKGNIPLSVIIGALGAAQIALIASRQIPEFKDGVRGFSGGLAVVGDGGRSEIVRTPSGELWRTPNKDTLVNLPKGSDVFKSEMDFIRNSGTLLGGMPHVIGDMRSGASASEMREIMREAMAGSATYVSNFDKRGFTGYVVTAGGKSISHNNKMSFKAKTFKN